MAIELWTSGDLYEVITDDRMDAVPDYFRRRFFGGTPYFSDDKEIQFARLPGAHRKLAPFVLPTEQGKPIFGRRGETVKAFTPPYIKPKDAIRAEDARTVLPSEVFRNNGVRPSMAQRFEARVVEVAQFHRRAIDMQIAWMCARAIIDAKLAVRYRSDNGAESEVTIDFGRDPNLTVVLTDHSWLDPNYDILGDLRAWLELVRTAEFGGNVNQMVVGAAVAGVFTKNKGILDLMSTQVRGGESVVLDRAVLGRTDEPLQYIGRLGPTLEVWTYRDQVETDDGTLVEIFDPKSILLSAPGAEGVLAFGGIYDVDALGQETAAIDIFPKMFKTPDPGEIYVMHQSAPLPIPLRPNRTLKARVIP